jgi:ATP-dependent DNA ligase
MNFTYLYPEKPKLINITQPLFQKLSDDPRWVAEPKYNGSRLLLAVDGKDMEFWNRHGERFEYTPCDELRANLVDFTEKTRGWCLFDGELRHNKSLGVRNRISLWDVLVWNGKLLVDVPYRHRRMYFPWQLGRNGHFEFVPQHLGGHEPFANLFEKWTKDPEIEGLVIKNLNGKLNLSRTAGQDSNWMVKVRRPNNSYRF